MPSDRKPSLILPVAGAVLLLLAAYVGAYYSMVEPVDVSGDPFHEVMAARYSDGAHWDGGFTRIFSPVHALDRRIRPRIWEGHESPTVILPRSPFTGGPYP